MPKTILGVFANFNEHRLHSLIEEQFYQERQSHTRYRLPFVVEEVFDSCRVLFDTFLHPCIHR